MSYQFHILDLTIKAETQMTDLSYTLKEILDLLGHLASEAVLAAHNHAELEKRVAELERPLFVPEEL